jgi:alkylation response protein AidB-like acyl-CoA dehydrogenase
MTATPRLDGPQWRFPFYGVLAMGIAAVSIGLLNGAVDRFAELATSKKPEGSGRTLSERSTGQAVVSSAEATARSTRSFLHDVIGEAWTTAEAGDPLTIEHRRSLRLAACDSAQRCADALTNLQREAGGAAVYLREPLQRMVRDGQVAATHAMVAPRIHELTGRLRFGLDTDTTLL